MMEGDRNNEGGIEMLDLDLEAQARAAKPKPPLAQRLLGKKTAEWMFRRCGCLCGCLGLNDEEYHGLVAGDGVCQPSTPFSQTFSPRFAPWEGAYGCGAARGVRLHGIVAEKNILRPCSCRWRDRRTHRSMTTTAGTDPASQARVQRGVHPRTGGSRKMTTMM